MMNKNERLTWRVVAQLLIFSVLPMVISCGMKQEQKLSTQTSQSVIKEKVQSSAVNSNSSIYEDEEPCGGDDIVIKPDEMPEFPSGWGACMNYLTDSLKYPESARKAHIQGRVIVQFLVTKTGEITDVEVVRPVEETLNAEALRLIKGMPKWTPAVKDGEKVDVKYTLPVTFRLNSTKL